jgi:DNA-binding CsgD family transcriptional regulator
MAAAAVAASCCYPDERWKAVAEVTDDRGMEVLRLIALGMKDDVIARALGVSRRTVQQNISDISALLGVRTRFHDAQRTVDVQAERVVLHPIGPGGEVFRPGDHCVLKAALAIDANRDCVLLWALYDPNGTR